MKTLTKILFILSVITYNSPLITYAQNLVPNPSFEEYSSCPDWYDQLNKATGWCVIINTPDYFNKCSANIESSVPYNTFGFQLPLNDSCKAYAGFFSYIEYSSGSIEYIGRELNFPLIVNQKYYVSFKVSLAHDNFAINCGVNKLGALFTNRFYGDTILIPPPFISRIPQVYSNSVIIDTVNWTTIFGSFVADSAYNYIVLGRFFDTSQVLTICFNTNQKQSYYYIDDICVSTDLLYAANYTNECSSNFKNTIYNNLYEFNSFPNPFSDKFSINISNIPVNISSIRLEDLWGNNYSINITERNKYLDIRPKDKLPNGIYIFKIQSNNKYYTNKIIKY